MRPQLTISTGKEVCVHALAVQYTVMEDQHLSSRGFDQRVELHKKMLYVAFEDLVTFYRTGLVDSKKNDDVQTIAEIAGYLYMSEDRYTPTYVGYHILSDLGRLGIFPDRDEVAKHVGA